MTMLLRVHPLFAIITVNHAESKQATSNLRLVAGYLRNALQINCDNNSNWRASSRLSHT